MRKVWANVPKGPFFRYERDNEPGLVSDVDELEEDVDFHRGHLCELLRLVQKLLCKQKHATVRLRSIPQSECGRVCLGEFLSDEPLIELQPAHSGVKLTRFRIFQMQDSSVCGTFTVPLL